MQVAWQHIITTGGQRSRVTLLRRVGGPARAEQVSSGRFQVERVNLDGYLLVELGIITHGAVGRAHAAMPRIASTLNGLYGTPIRRRSGSASSADSAAIPAASVCSPVDDLFNSDSIPAAIPGCHTPVPGKRHALLEVTRWPVRRAAGPGPIVQVRVGTCFQTCRRRSIYTRDGFNEHGFSRTPSFFASREPTSATRPGWTGW